MNNLEFSRELQKTFITLGQDVRMTLFFWKCSLRVVSTLTCSNLTLCGLCVLSLDPEGGEEVCTAGAAAAGGGRAEEAEDRSGAAVPPGPAGRRHCATGPEAGSRRLNAADGCGPHSFWWVLQVSWARPWPKRQVSLRHWYLDEFEMQKTFSTLFFFNKRFHITYLCTCRLADQYEEASVHLWDLLEGKEKAVVGTTCESNLTWSLQMVAVTAETFIHRKFISYFDNQLII